MVLLRHSGDHAQGSEDGGVQVIQEASPGRPLNDCTEQSPAMSGVVEVCAFTTGEQFITHALCIPHCI